MKKVLLLFVMLLIPNIFVNAEIKSTNLKEALEEEIEIFSAEEYKVYDYIQGYVKTMKNADLSNYVESEDKVNVYIFRGAKCPHCAEELAWFSTQVKEYGRYFNIVSYEVWNNTDNKKLMEDTAKKINETVKGVPYTIIGNKSFSGFLSDSTDKEMLKAIIEEYRSKEKHDVLNAGTEENKSNNNKDNNYSNESIVSENSDSRVVDVNNPNNQDVESVSIRNIVFIATVVGLSVIVLLVMLGIVFRKKKSKEVDQQHFDMGDDNR